MPMNCFFFKLKLIYIFSFPRQLELFAKRQTIHAKIDDNYIPKAVSVGILKTLMKMAPLSM